METKLNYNFTKSFSLDIWGILNTPLFIIISHFSQNFITSLFLYRISYESSFIPVGNYIFKVNNKNT